MTKTIALVFLTSVFSLTTHLTIAETVPPGKTTQAPNPADSKAAAIPKVGDTAADFTLDSINGTDTKTVKLTDLTSKGPVVLVVLRGWPGYQCPICTKQVADILAHEKEIVAAGAKVVMIYPGPADKLKGHAEEFFKDKTFSDTYRLLIDPDYKFTNAWGLRWDKAKETAYPSTFVIDRQNIIRFAKVSKTHGDRASTADVVKALGEIK